MRRRLGIGALCGLTLVVTSASAAPLSADDIALINRVTWGATPQDIAQAQSMGMNRWLKDQLHPRNDGLPPPVQARVADLWAMHRTPQSLIADFNALAAAPVVVLASNPANAGPMMAPGGAPAHVATLQELRNSYKSDVRTQAQLRQMWMEIYSPAQLREQMTWFWFNHFNVHFDKGENALTIGDYEDQVIRARALGNFRDLLEATLRHPAMERYLDNAGNAVGHVNENYAREIMELHTLGVGSGYTQKDVQELARILTGVGVNPSGQPIKVGPKFQPFVVEDGLFAFYPNRHDFGDKLFLGYVIKGSGYGEVKEALDILAASPATAKHVSRQLAQYFVADQPPASLVNAMADRFQSSHGDIAQVLTVMFHAPEFRASLARPLFKDPQHYVVSAVRLAFDERTIVNPRPMLGWMNQLAEAAYSHTTPEGYALERAAWNGSGQMETRFEIARQIGAGAPGLFRPDPPKTGGPNPPAPAPVVPPIQGDLSRSGLLDTVTPDTLTVLAQAKSPQEWNTLFLSSPDFMRR